MSRSDLTRVFCICVLVSTVASACGSTHQSTQTAARELPAPEVRPQSDSAADLEDLTGLDEVPANDQPAASITPVATDPCGLWGEAIQTLIAGGSLEEQANAVERWLEGIDEAVESQGSDELLHLFRDGTDALDSVDWDVSAVESERLASLVGGFQGAMPDGGFEVPSAMRDECSLDLSGAAAANAYLDCVVGLSPAFSLVVDADAEGIGSWTELEEVAFVAEFGLRLTSETASPLCMSQILWEVSAESIMEATSSKSPDEALVIAAASMTMIEAVEILGGAAVQRFEPVGTAIN